MSDLEFLENDPVCFVCGNSGEEIQQIEDEPVSVGPCYRCLNKKVPSRPIRSKEDLKAAMDASIRALEEHLAKKAAK